MKTLRFPFFIKLSCLIIGLASLQGCKNPAEDVSIQVNTDIFKSSTVISFKNANAAAADPANISLSFTGPGASLVRTITGGTNFKVVNGFINIALDRNANPSAANPIKVTAVISAPGYAPSNLELTFTDPEAKQFHTIEMFQYSRPPEGVAAVVKTQALVGGQTAAPVTIATVPNATQAQSTTIAIPASTAFKDAAGNAVNGAQLETRMVYTTLDAQGQPKSDLSLKPVTKAFDANDQPIAGNVKASAVATASINMFAGSTQVKSFTNPITLDMELPAGGINPITKQAYKVGDVFDAWSTNESTGELKREGTASVVLNTANKLVVRKQITHLSIWGFGIISLAEERTVNVTINRNQNTTDEYFTIYIRGRADQTVLLKAGESTKTFAVKYIHEPLFINAVAVEPVLGNVYDPSLFNYAILTQNNQNLTANFTKMNNGIPATLILTVKCNNKNLTTKPNMVLKFVNLTTNNEYILTLENGVGVGTVYNGERYRVFAEFDGVSYSTTFTVSNGTAQIDLVENLTASVRQQTAILVNGGFIVDAQITKKCND